MAVSGVGSGFVFRSTSQKKENTKKEDGGTFGDILEASERSSNDPLTTQEMMREIRDRIIPLRLRSGNAFLRNLTKARKSWKR